MPHPSRPVGGAGAPASWGARGRRAGTEARVFMGRPPAFWTSRARCFAAQHFNLAFSPAGTTRGCERRDADSPGCVRRLTESRRLPPGPGPARTALDNEQALVRAEVLASSRDRHEFQGTEPRPRDAAWPRRLGGSACPRAADVLPVACGPSAARRPPSSAVVEALPSRGSRPDRLARLRRRAICLDEQRRLAAVAGFP